jgi:hypothetical protein
MQSWSAERRRCHADKHAERVGNSPEELDQRSTSQFVMLIVKMESTQ